VLGDTLSNADNEGNLGLEGLLDTGSGQRRRDEETSSGSASLLDGF
jgi:hypothetical protein